jgi:hypothetical protein
MVGGWQLAVGDLAIGELGQMPAHSVRLIFAELD